MNRGGWKDLDQGTRRLGKAAGVALSAAVLSWALLAGPALWKEAALRSQLRGLEVRLAGRLVQQKARRVQKEMEPRLRRWKARATGAAGFNGLGEAARRAGLTVHEQDFGEGPRQVGIFALRRQGLVVEGSGRELKAFLAGLRRGQGLVAVEQAGLERLGDRRLRASLKLLQVEAP